MSGSAPALVECLVHPIHLAELIWFWGDAQGELGLRAASLEPNIRASGPDPHSATGDGLVDRRAEAADRYARISRTLTRCGARHTRTLQRYCGPHRSAPALIAQFGDLAGVVTRTNLAGSHDIVRLVRDLTAKLETPEATQFARTRARMLVGLVHAEALQMVREAAREYAAWRPTRKGKR